MKKKLTLERDNLDRKIISRKISEIHEDNNETDELGRQYVQDNESIDRLIQMTKDSKLTREDKEEQLESLNKAKRVLLERYKEKVEERKKENNEELKDLIDKVQDVKQEAEEQKNEMDKMKMETGEVSLDDNLKKQEELIEWLDKIKTDESEELKRSQEVTAALRRQMERNKGRML